MTVNVGGAHNLVAACKAAGVRRVINISSQAARLERRGAYGQSKADSDEVFTASGLEVTTLLPSLVYGPNDSGVFGKLARVTASAPFVPVIGDGRTEYRTVHVDDVCAVIAGCLREPKTIGKTYCVGGPESITFDGLVDQIGAAQGRTPLKVHIPGWVAMLIARTLAPFFAAPPLTVSNVLGGIQSSPDADYAAVFAELSLTPRSLAEGLKAGIV